jgi:outer membrane protein
MMRRVRITIRLLLACATISSTFICQSALAAPARAPAPGPTLTLSQAIESAIAHNPTMEKIRTETQAAHGDVIRARSSFLPKIEATAGIEHTVHQPSITVPPNTFGNPDGVYFPLADKTIPYAGLRLEQSLYDFGRSTGRYREATKAQETSALAEDLFSQDLALLVTQAYLDVLLARDKVELAKSTLAAYESHLDTALRMHLAGAIPQNDVLNADVARAQASLQLTAAQNNVRVAELRFEKIVGASPESLDRSAMGSRAPSYKVSDKLAYAQENRIELAINDRLQSIAKAQKSQAKSEYLPDISARARVFYREDSLASHKEQAQVGAELRWPLFDGLAAYGSGKKAKSKLAGAEFDRQALLDNIEVEVTRAHLDVTQATHAMQVAKTAIKEASENLRTIKERYASGEAPASDVLDGIASWKEALFLNAQALYDVNLANAKLRRASGEEITGEDR